MPFGFFDTNFIDYPANIDQAYIAGLETAEGVQFTTVLQELDARLGALNGSLDAWIANKISVTEESALDTSQPVAFVVDERGEYTVARPQFVENAGVMLPIRGYDISLAFTEDALLNARMSTLITNFESLLLGLRELYLKRTGQRLFNNSEYRIAPQSTATSPGFAGSGTGLNAFTGPYPDGSALPGGYTHYYVANTSNAGEFKTILKAMLARLKKWNQGPFNFTGNDTITALVTALTSSDPMDGFVAANSSLIRVGSGTNEALVSADEYLGVLFGEVLVEKPRNLTATPVGSMYKSFGNLNPMNPLVWRFDPRRGRNAVVRDRGSFPLTQAIVKQDFGIGVKNRTAVANVYAAAGASSYTNPTDL
jgi:hypothetical protein